MIGSEGGVWVGLELGLKGWSLEEWNQMIGWSMRMDGAMEWEAGPKRREFFRIKAR